MKIYRKSSLPRLSSNFDEEFWTNIFLVIFHLICCCCQGDYARSLDVVPSVSFECHVTLGQTSRRYVPYTCSCNCWIWCKDSQKCKKLDFLFNANIILLYSSEETLLYKGLVSAYRSCCNPQSSSPAFFKRDHLELDFNCTSSHEIVNSSKCDIDWGNSGCCFVQCEDNEECSYFQLYPTLNDSQVPPDENKELSKDFEGHARKNNSLLHLRPKRSGDLFLSPLRIEVSGNPREVAVLQPFQLSARIVDKEGTSVNIAREVSLDVLDITRRKRRDILEGKFSNNFTNGQVHFSNVSFLQVGKSYQLTVSSYGSPEIQSWSSAPIVVTERPLNLRPSGRTLPISPRENDTFSPAAGVIIYDVIDDAPANKSYLSQFTWEVSIGLLYDDIYPGELFGTTFKLVEDGSNEILFTDIVISNWGYSYILEIKLQARNTPYWNLTCLIGPFDVDMLDTFELPLIESDEFRTVRIVFDGDYSRILQDRRKFEIFFMNYFGRGYPRVRWKNVTMSEGSVVVDAVITGLTEDLDKTSKILGDDIASGKADIQYEGGQIWKANRASVPSRKLLEESGNAEGQSGDDGGGLSVAWLVAIIINVVLIIFFILAIIYCWLRRKKQVDSRAGSALDHFDGGKSESTTMFSNKEAIKKKKSMADKAALMNGGRIFTIEDEGIEHHNHRPDERCTCYSPTCYCSTGDGRKTDSRLDRMTEENEDDPQGYPTPTPPPTFPTPEPSPDPEEYWRPDSYQQEPEEEENEDMFLPGTVTEPEPEGPREDRYYVYHVTDIDGSRELFGQIYLQVDSFLNDVRKAIDRDRDLSDAIRKNEYRFLDENLDTILTYQESSLDLERVFPSQEINIQFLQQRNEVVKEPQVSKVPAYVGPLGICSASDCTRAAKIKCLDCRNTAYCSKRCMREDIKEHRRACYKPAWRV